MNKAEGRELRAEVGALLHPDAGCRREADRRLKSHSQGDRELEEGAAEQRKATPEGQRSRLRSQVREEERRLFALDNVESPFNLTSAWVGALGKSSWTQLGKQRQDLEATPASYLAPVGVRKTEHSWVERGDQGRWFALVWFFDVGDAETSQSRREA